MPHIRMRAIEKEQVQKLSQTLIPKLSDLVKSPVDHFTLELVQTAYFTDGREVESNPFVEMLWFARPQEVQDQVAKLINQEIVALTKAQDVVVVFHELNKTGYYENGEHF